MSNPRLSKSHHHVLGDIEMDLIGTEPVNLACHRQLCQVAGSVYTVSAFGCS